ncbi:MAG: Acetylornithine deacetylase [Verrucomicrobiales bacterium]|nr:Acetylornithine deacetylase [Verrucomicrobiales bacterium]
MTGSRTEKLLSDLIALPSVNPAFLIDRPDLTGEARVAYFISDLGRKAKLDVHFQEVFPGRCNVFLHAKPKGKSRNRILFAPHMDTVGAAGATHDIFSPRQAKNRIYGRGACDTKGCIAAVLSGLLDVIQDKGAPPATEFIFCGLIDEEEGQTGSRALINSGFKADLAIVGEPTNLKIVTAHKGDLWLQITTQGKSAHGSQPELGQNAVLKMARVVELLETKYAKQLRKNKHPLLGNGTINVGSIRGGSQPNIVPADCCIEVDRRTLPGETEQFVRQELNALFRRNELTAKIKNNKSSPCPALETDPTLPFVKKFFESTGQTEKVGANFFCDAAIIAGGGIPSVVFGPGNIAQAHTADEWISIASLEKAASVYRRFIESFY